jgi:hypothetical protein
VLFERTSVAHPTFLVVLKCSGIPRQLGFVAAGADHFNWTRFVSRTQSEAKRVSHRCRVACNIRLIEGWYERWSYIRTELNALAEISKLVHSFADPVQKRLQHRLDSIGCVEGWLKVA